MHLDHTRLKIRLELVVIKALVHIYLMDLLFEMFVQELAPPLLLLPAMRLSQPLVFNLNVQFRSFKGRKSPR